MRSRNRTIIIGTRGSALALAQTEQIRKQILDGFPHVEISVRIIKTSADRNPASSIRAGSSVGVFVKELEQALLSGEIDMAVHSMKDVPTKIPDGLQIAAIPEREDVRDALVAGSVSSLAQLPSGALLGTGSVRRQAQILALRPDLRISDIRGNIDSRLKKLQDGVYDAIILACAGLNRLGFQKHISMPLAVGDMLPAPGQGAIGVETRADDARIPPIAAALNHTPTAIAVSAERSFLQRMGGGCNIPVAVYARLKESIIEIDGLVASPDGKKIIRESIQQVAESADEAAVHLADRILLRGGRAILSDIYQPGGIQSRDQ
ncbi:MAG: hydroxymethylbilane synthase [Acidobacteria bacterium]|nr:hydroxymethylbilane synthase [Acidobacteriota bacterium]